MDLAKSVIAILIVIVIGVVGRIIYFTTRITSSASDWITDGVEAGFTTGITNHYGVPKSFICPNGVIQNLTIAPI